MALSTHCGANPRALNHPTPLTSVPTSTCAAISQLQATWHVLPDYERAQALEPIVDAGVSRRYLARALNTSEGTIRQLLFILQEAQADLTAFLNGTISRNELVRRVKGTSTEVPMSEKPDLRFSESHPAVRYFRVRRDILEWLAEDEQRASSAALILGLALAQLDRGAGPGTLFQRPADSGASTETVIASCRPDPNRFAIAVSWYAAWLANWVVSLIPDPALCRHALNMALARVRTCISRPDLW